MQPQVLSSAGTFTECELHTTFFYDCHWLSTSYYKVYSSSRLSHYPAATDSFAPLVANPSTSYFESSNISRAETSARPFHDLLPTGTLRRPESAANLWNTTPNSCFTAAPMAGILSSSQLRSNFLHSRTGERWNHRVIPGCIF